MTSNDPTHQPTDTGDQLRDARLVRALEHAPDVQEAVQPAAALRESILRAAHDAVTAAPTGPMPAPWWSRWTEWLRGSTSAERTPWNAAFATVLLAGFITLLWRNEPIPPAQMDGPAPTVQQDAAAPPPPAAAPPVPAELPAQNMEREAKKAAPPAVRRTAPVAPAQDSAAGGAPPMAHESAVAAAPAMPVPPPPAAPAAAPARAQAPVPVAPGEATADSAAPAAAAKQQDRARAPAALSVAPRVPAATSALPADWTHLRRADAVTAHEGVPRAEAGDLPRLLEALKTGGEAETSPGDGLSTVTAVRVALLRGGSVLGVLELSGSRWRFVPEPGSGRAAHQGVLPDVQARALLAALQRVAP